MRLRSCLAVAILLVTGTSAAGDRETAAQVLFDDALALMTSGKYPEACSKLEASQRLDPGMGTQFRLAECWEKLGKSASAWSLFLEVEKAARDVGQGERADVARQRAETIRPMLPRLVIAVPPDARLAGLSIKRGGVEIDAALFGSAVPVDPGGHRIEATAPGRVAHEQTVSAKSGQTVSVTIPVLRVPGAAAGPAPGESPPPTGQADRSPSTGRIALIGTSAVIGVAGIVVGTVFGLKASSTWDEALAGCQGGATDRCTTDAQTLGDDASGDATLSTIGFVVGGVGLAGAAVLWLTRPSAQPTSASVRVAPIVGASSGGAVVRGRF